MNYGRIFLLPEEIALLKEMNAGKEFDRYTQGIMSLRENELISMINNSQPEFDEKHRIIMMYRINEDGKRFLQYLDREECQEGKSRRHDFLITVLSIVTIAASIISAVFAILAYFKS